MVTGLYQSRHAERDVASQAGRRLALSQDGPPASRGALPGPLPRGTGCCRILPVGYRQWVPLWIEDQPHSQDSIVAMLVTNAGWRASVWFGNGTAMIGKPVPTTSLS